MAKISTLFVQITFVFHDKAKNFHSHTLTSCFYNIKYSMFLGLLLYLNWNVTKSSAISIICLSLIIVVIFSPWSWWNYYTISWISKILIKCYMIKVENLAKLLSSANKLVHKIWQWQTKFFSYFLRFSMASEIRFPLFPSEKNLKKIVNKMMKDNFYYLSKYKSTWVCVYSTT